MDKLKKSPYCGVLHFYSEEKKKQLTNRPVGETYYTEKKSGRGEIIQRGCDSNDGSGKGIKG